MTAPIRSMGRSPELERKIAQLLRRSIRENIRMTDSMSYPEINYVVIAQAVISQFYSKNEAAE